MDFWSDNEFGEREDFMTPEEAEREWEHGVAMGDPRRCPVHPHVETSSPDGMFDAPCGECEYEMSVAAAETAAAEAYHAAKASRPVSCGDNGFPGLMTPFCKEPSNDSLCYESAEAFDNEIPF